MKILCVWGRHNYGDPARGLGYEYVNFIPAFESLGHEACFFESWNKSEYSDYADLNRQLLQTVEREQPDIIFFVLMTYEVWLETLQLIREGSNAALIHWATDDSWKYEQFSRFMAPAFDLYVTTYPSAIEKSERDGMHNFVLSQWAADASSMQPPLPATECRYAASFVGSAYGNRKQWVESLQRRGIPIEAFGYGWPNGPVAAEDIGRIIRESQVSLNFGDSGVVMEGGKVQRSRQIKARVFEVPGAGGLLATEPAAHLEDYYVPGEEIVLFEDLDGLVEQINELLTHPEKRDAIALAGYERTRNEHSYRLRFQPLIEQGLQVRRERAHAGRGIDFDRFEMVARAHRTSSLLRLMKGLMSLPFMLIWGRQRGARAARRALFELSWRLVGRRVYTAGGLVGRLFYHER